MRGLADQIGPALGVSVVVEDRTGAGGSIGARACAEAPPDGYTICILPGEATVYNPIIEPIAGFDPKTALAPITRAFYLTQVFAVSASLQVKSFADLAAVAKAKPKTLNYMAPSLSEVAFMEAFNKKNGTDIVRVPFKGGGDAVNSMLSGTTQIAIFGIGNLVQFIRNGKIVGLAVDGDTRSPLAPDIPTFKQLGYKDFILADLLRHLRADRHAEADHRQAQQGDRRRRIEAGLPAAVSDQPRFDAGLQRAGAVRQGACDRPRRRPCRGEGVGALSEREVIRSPGGSFRDRTRCPNSRLRISPCPHSASAAHPRCRARAFPGRPGAARRGRGIRRPLALGAKG